MELNLQVQKRSKEKPQPGDVFSLKLPDELFLFGMVVGAELPSGRAPMPGSYLLYIYDHRSDNPVPDLAQLRPDRLLLAPYFTNRMLWTKGYAVTVSAVSLSPDNLLRQHCFWHPLRKSYCDENGALLSEKHEPCGSWGLGSYRKLDDLISDAVGISRVPLQPGD
jgi:hypothetical protein